MSQRMSRHGWWKVRSDIRKNRRVSLDDLYRAIEQPPAEPRRRGPEEYEFLHGTESKKQGQQEKSLGSL